MRDDIIKVEHCLGQLEAAAERLALPQTGLIQCLALPGRPVDLPEGPSLSAVWLDEPLGASPGRMTRREWLLLRLKAPQIVHADGLDAPWDAASLRSQIPRSLSNGLHFVGNTAPGSGLAMNSAMLRDGLSALATGATWRKPVLLHAQNAHRIAPEQDSLLLPPETLRIGHLLWEYNVVPDAHLPGLARLDEIWAPSRFVEQLYTPVAPCPVHWVGKGISLPKPQGQRSVLCPTFCVVLDSRSGLARKNPVAALRAFRAAFPPPIQAKLIIKMTPEPEHGFLDPEAQRAEIFAAAARDPRIEIVEDMLPLPKLLGVIKSATALVSPHRGEGFGYVPAFALSIGVPAIVSDTGGVQDFCTAQTAWPVPGTQAAIVQETLPHPVPEGTWFEICEDMLAQTMVEVVERPAKAAEKARRGAALMAHVYSPQAYAKRL
ncbi:MAG: glycosyltransferase, partial [Pseudomonadota bacterium]